MVELHSQGHATLLRGNHEQMALDAYVLYQKYQATQEMHYYRDAFVAFGRWLRAGGDVVRREYSLFGVENYPVDFVHYLNLTEIVVYVSSEGVTRQQPTRIPSVMCSHAAPPVARGNYPADEAAMWLRPYEGPFPLADGVRYSIHGHTPIAQPMRIAQQIYTDLGGFLTGKLCTVRLDTLPYQEQPEITVFHDGTVSRNRLPVIGFPLLFRTVTVSHV